MKQRLDPERYVRLGVTLSRDGEARLSRVQDEQGRDVPASRVSIEVDAGSGQMDVVFRVPVALLDLELVGGEPGCAFPGCGVTFANHAGPSLRHEYQP